jgi:hypothetical protein
MPLGQEIILGIGYPIIETHAGAAYIADRRRYI